jgi:hypothetical protein
MRKLIVLFCLMSFHVKAQTNLMPLLTPGNKWSSDSTYLENGGVSPPTAILKKYVYRQQYEVLAKDTVIGNTLFQQIKHSESTSCIGPCTVLYSAENTIYLRQVGNSFFKAPTTIGSQEKSLFGFTGTSVGDSIWGNDVHEGHVISKIDTVSFRGGKVRRFYIPNSQTPEYVDGIGFTGGGIRPRGYVLWEGGDTRLTCLEMGGDHYQVVSSQSNIQFNLAGSTCFSPIVLGMEDENLPVFTFSTRYLSYDAVEIRSSLSSIRYKFALLDANGKMMYQVEEAGNALISLDSFLQGIYFLQVYRNGEVVYKNKIIKL